MSGPAKTRFVGFDSSDEDNEASDEDKNAIKGTIKLAPMARPVINLKLSAFFSTSKLRGLSLTASFTLR